MKEKVSLIIPSLSGSRGGNLKKLTQDISKQSFQPDEVVIVAGAKPCSRAHNIGVKAAKGEIIIFFDDDVRLGDREVIKNLLRVLEEKKDMGIVGASQVIPRSSNRFQKKCATQVYRSQSPIVKKVVESDMATHAGMAIKKSLYEKVGGEEEFLYRNDDTYLRYKIKKLGYKVVLVPNAWVYHPMPRNLFELIKRRFYQGIDQAHDYKFYPSYIYESPLKQGEFHRKSNLANQIVRNLKIIVRSIFRMKLILLISRLATGMGFIYGYMKNPIDQNNKPQNQVEIIKIK